MVIDFSGTAGQIRDAFQTEIHHLDVNGVGHIANMSNPQIPARSRLWCTGSCRCTTSGRTRISSADPPTRSPSGGSTYQAVVPADLATIYNLNPLFAAGISGQGQTIVVIEDTNVYSTSRLDDASARPSVCPATRRARFTQVHPTPASGANNCTNPGVVAGNESEADLDAEWASAAAPSAAIELASCEDTRPRSAA